MLFLQQVILFQDHRFQWNCNKVCIWRKLLSLSDLNVTPTQETTVHNRFDICCCTDYYLILHEVHLEYLPHFFPGFLWFLVRFREPKYLVRKSLGSNRPFDIVKHWLVWITFPLAYWSISGKASYFVMAQEQHQHSDLRSCKWKTLRAEAQLTVWTEDLSKACWILSAKLSSRVKRIEKKVKYMSEGPDWTDNTKNIDKCSPQCPRAQPNMTQLNCLFCTAPKIQNLKNCTLWSHKKKKCTNQKAENLNNLVNWSRECLTFFSEKWLQLITHRTVVKTFHSRMSASRCCWLRKSQGIIKIRKIHPLRTMKYKTGSPDHNLAGATLMACLNKSNMFTLKHSI